MKRTTSIADSGVVAERVGVQYLTVDPMHAGRRIDNYLGTYLKSLPPSRLYSMLRRGEVRVSGKRVKPTYRLLAYDTLRLPPTYLEPPRKSAPVCADLLEAVLYEDEQFVVMNKPAGVAVHGGSGLAFGMVESLRAMRTDLDYLELAHRLDRDTSGCLLLAKSPSVLRQLHALFRDNLVEKHYIALVRGRVPERRYRIHMPLRRLRQRDHKRSMGGVEVICDPAGKQATTEVMLKACFNIGKQPFSLIDVMPLTGRTHQIRAHLAHNGHPLAGDSKYGERTDNVLLRECGLKRLFLHAMRLSLLPSKHKDDTKLTRQSWSASLPDELSMFLNQYVSYQVE